MLISKAINNVIDDNSFFIQVRLSC